MNKKRKKQTGFTLIELLVTIALMLSILGIAIVSFINVSDRKKQEAWEQVKGQIETAAIEYFMANEYLYNELSEGANGTITIEELVKKDYLNSVVNPVTGKTIPKCSYVNVAKKERGFSMTFNEESLSTKNTVCPVAVEINEITEDNKKPNNDPKKASTFEIAYRNEKDNDINYPNSNKWFSLKDLGDKGQEGVCVISSEASYKPLKIVIKPNLENGNIKSVRVNDEEAIKNKNNEYIYIINEDCENMSLNIIVTNEYDLISKQILEISKDTIRPTLSYQLSYKVFNIAGTNNLNTINNGSKKHGVTIRKGATDNQAIINWKNVQGLENVNKIEFRDDGNSVKYKMASFEFKVKDKNGNYLGGVTPSYEYAVSNNHDVHKYVASWPIATTISEMEFTLNCSKEMDNCVDYVRTTNGSGLSIFTEKKEDCEADVKNNYNNYIRLDLTAEDSGSQIDDKKIEHNKENISGHKYEWVKDNDFLKNSRFVFTSGNASDPSKHNYHYEGKFQFKVTDNAGNSSNILNVNTIDKFN